MIELILSIIGDIIRSTLRLVRYLLLTLVALLLMIFLIIPLTLKGLGYYIASPGWVIGELAAEKRDISLCDRIWAYHILGPTTEQRIISCNLTYHDIIKKMRFCIDHYKGMQINYCIEQSNLHSSCYINGENIFVCGPVPNGIPINDANCRNTQSKNYHNPFCIIERVANDEAENDCSGIANTTIRDECSLARAVKWRNAEECEAIEASPMLRSTCHLALQPEPKAQY